MLFKLRGARIPPPDVAVIGINNKTAHDLGLYREPILWPRAVHARLIDRLLSLNAQGIVFDIDFPAYKPGDEDTALADAIDRANRVILFEWVDAPEKITNTQHSQKSVPVVRIWRPAEVLVDNARAIGPWVLAKIDEAAFQFWTFKSGAGDTPTIPAIALQLKGLTVYDEWLKVLREANAPNVNALPAHVEEVKTPDELEQLMRSLRSMLHIPEHSSDDDVKTQIDPKEEREKLLLQQEVAQKIDKLYGGHSDETPYQLLKALAALYSGPDYYFINFYGPPGTIRYVPYQSLVMSDDKGPKLSNSMVFVGRANAPDPDHPKEVDPDFPDRFYTSFTKDALDLSGVEIMATAYANLLSGRTLTPAGRPISLAAVLTFGFLIGTAACILSPMIAVPAVFAIAALYTLFILELFSVGDFWLPLAIPWLVQLPAALLIGPMAQYVLMRRRKQELQKAISYYLPERLVRDLAERPVDPRSLDRDDVFGICLATDMSNFTALSEKKLPGELAAFMNTYYFDPIAEAVQRHGVDVAEFRADMIMCAWMAPERSAELCCKGMEAALEVSEIITGFAQQFAWHNFTPRVGLQGGQIRVGHTGGAGHFVYNITGYTANIAARLEGWNKDLHTHVLASESVAQETNDLLCRPLGLFRSPDISRISVCEILGRKADATSEQLDLCAQFAESLAVFMRRDWLSAANMFGHLSARFAKDGPSRFFQTCACKFAEDAYEGDAIIQMKK